MLQYLQAQQVSVSRQPFAIGRYDAAPVLLVPPDEESKSLDALGLEMAGRPSLLPSCISITCTFKFNQTTYSHASGHMEILKIIKNMCYVYLFIVIQALPVT